MNVRSTRTKALERHPLCLGLVITAVDGGVSRLLASFTHDPPFATALTIGTPSHTKVPVALETQVGEDEAMINRIRDHADVSHVDIVYAESSELYEARDE